MDDKTRPAELYEPPLVTLPTAIPAPVRAQPRKRLFRPTPIRPIFDAWLLRRRSPARRGLQLQWLICLAGSTVVVLLGVDFGRQFVIPGPWFKAPEPFVESMVHWDGGYFFRIAESGYTHTPGQPSRVHFFPLYPLIGSLVSKVTGWSVQLALVVVSHLFFAAALFLLGQYMDRRYGAEQHAERSAALLALSFVPAGMFFHMAYTESLFLLLCIVELYLIDCRVHPLFVALVAGLAIATRAVGVGLLAPLLLYLARYARRPKAFLGWCCLCLPLALSGVIVYGLYCQWAFGDAFATLRDRATLWAMRPLPALPEKVLALATLQPVWEIFVPSSSAYWRIFTSTAQIPFSLYVANPLYFVGALAAVVIGWWNRWLNRYEIGATLGLLFVPYWTLGHESQMVSMARYVVVIAPVYLVAGKLLAKLPPAVGGCLLGVSATLLAAYAAVFARWYWMV
ncbi:MAG TPA: mannosyltransferase family protein [Gemmataceae bacterium]|nr:mannosyltransferase family protein [Gemmataceae bacterium]